ncbi:MAG: RNA ligase family protein [Nostoc sp.]|uniref:RNA ligase family protein n=1 Tax=Nostoc sp. TaxID=1180 RepID=UPI002FFD2B2D
MDTLKGNVNHWTYVSYEKIPESLNRWNLTESDYRAFKKTDWVVTEKIHGANFGITTDGSEVRFANRKEFLQPDSDFFDYQSLKDKLAVQIQEIFRILQTERHQLRKVSIYGELFGGEYPHPDVPAISHVQAIQTGVYYSPKIEYCAFDISLEQNGNLTERTYLDYDKALKLFQQVGMMGAEALFIGKYSAALAYSIGFDSTIPAALGLPKLQQVNKAEGIVIKPIKTIYVETPKGRIRPILKIKIPEFMEDSRFHQATKWVEQKLQITNQYLSLESELCQEMLVLVTETRLNNVISKIGRIYAHDKKQKQQLIELLFKDVLETFNEEYESLFNSLSGDNQQTIMQQLHQDCQKLVDGYFK